MLQRHTAGDSAREDVRLALSIGGSKYAGAVVSGDKDVRAMSGRKEWPAGADTLTSRLELLADLQLQLLSVAGTPFAALKRIVLAFPGPGRYSEGLLEATFIPGCRSRQPVHRLLRQTLEQRVGERAQMVPMLSLLDVQACARGELLLGEAFRGAADGLVVNIATGIAGAIVHDGNVLAWLAPYGETYGQWGRFLIRNLATGAWHWRPSPDGATPPYAVSTEERLTHLCGGPAIAARWRHCLGAAAANGRLALPEERLLLCELTRRGYAGDRHAQDFIGQIGRDLGTALSCLRAAIGPELFGRCILLAGGVGRFFGLPPAGSTSSDLLLDAIGAALEINPDNISRSTLGLDAELIGAAAYAGMARTTAAC